MVECELLLQRLAMFCFVQGIWFFLSCLKVETYRFVLWALLVWAFAGWPRINAGLPNAQKTIHRFIVIAVVLHISDFVVPLGKWC